MVAAACTTYAAATFTHNYADTKGKDANGQPWDTAAMKSDTITCPWRHAHDYTLIIDDFSSNSAGTTFDLIKNEAVAHAGLGSTYMVVCWTWGYTNLDTGTHSVATTHDWKLVLDAATPTDWAAAIQFHLAGGAGAAALKGLYSQSSTPAGQNGDPCPAGTPPETKKPIPGDLPNAGVCIPGVTCIHI